MNKMSNKDLTVLLRAAFADAAPDKISDILDTAKSQKSVPTYSIVQENYKKKYLQMAGLIAAVIVLIVGLTLTLTAIHTNTPCSAVTVESDECIEITLNRDNRPLSISGRNSAAIRLARKIGSCSSLEDAVDGTLDAMLENGNLNENSNTILITVDAPENEKELLNTSLKAAKNSFAESDYDGAILTAVASEDKTVTRIARHNRISVGKAEMVTEILRKDRSFVTENLCRLSVNDLNLLSSSRRIIYSDIGVFGESRGCITPQTALMRAAEEAGYDDSNATATLGADLYGLVYRVTVHAGEDVYIYRLNAVSGEILEVSRDDSPQTALMADSTAPSPRPTEKAAEPTTAAAEGSAQQQGSTMRITPAPVIPPPSPGGVPAPTEAPKPAPTAAKQPAAPKPTEKPQKPKPQPAAQKPTRPAPAPTQKPTAAPAPTDPPKRDPAVFTADSYLRYTGGLQNRALSSSAKQIAVRRVVNGYNVYYDNTSFPYSPAGKQGGITALVCNREQFYRLTGKNDSRFSDAYFSAHALYVHMNRDANYHWIKSIDAAYMDGGTLYLKNSEAIGCYISTDSEHPERIYTVIYELDKSDLKDFETMVETAG